MIVPFRQLTDGLLGAADVIRAVDPHDRGAEVEVFRSARSGSPAAPRGWALVVVVEHPWRDDQLCHLRARVAAVRRPAPPAQAGP